MKEKIISEIKYFSNHPFNKTPNIVESNWKEVNTNDLISVTKYPKFKDKLHVIKKNENSNGITDEELNIIFGNGKRLYTGFFAKSMVSELLFEGNHGYSSNNSEDFGYGFYTFDDINYALKYAQPSGALLIFDWSGKKECIQKVLSLSEWKETVNGYHCRNNKCKHPGRPIIKCDILIGPISENYNCNCIDHIPNYSINQYVAHHTDIGYNLFCERLIGIIYLQ